MRGIIALIVGFIGLASVTAEAISPVTVDDGAVLLRATMPEPIRIDDRGLACVVSEDTIRVGRPLGVEGCEVGRVKRFVMIAVPRLDQPGGPEAVATLRGLVEGKVVHCFRLQKSDADRIANLHEYIQPEAYGSDCRVEQNGRMASIEVARAMVEAGVARNCPRYSGIRYRDDENHITALKRGEVPVKGFVIPDRCKPER